MKKIIHLFRIQLLLIAFINTQSFSASELFRSNASGNWNSTATWEMSTNGGANWTTTSLIPSSASGTITIRNPHTVTVNSNESADQLVISTGAQITITNGFELKLVDGTSQDLKLETGASVSGPGNIRTRGVRVDLTLVNGCNFSAPLIVDSGTCTAGDIASPFIGKFSGAITINSGASITPYGGQTIQANDNVTNNGTIAVSTNSSFAMRGASFVNNGVITILNLSFDSITSISGTGIITASSLLSIGSSGNVSLASDVTFSPNTFNINSGGVLNPNTKILTLTSGTMTLNSGATISNSGTFRTQGTPLINIKQGASFLAPFNVNTGTTTISEGSSPSAPVMNGTVSVDPGASLIPGAGHNLILRNNVVNNGTLGPNTNSTMTMKGSSLVNNGAVTVAVFRLDSTTTLSSTGTYTSSSIFVGSQGNVTLSNDVAFTTASVFEISTGGVFNLNGKIFTYNLGLFTLKTGASVNPGTFKTQGSVRLTIDTGSTFNSNLKVNNGTTTISQSTAPFIPRLNGTITVDSGATLTNTGGSSIQANNDVLNNGTITPFNSHFRVNGSSFINNNNVDTELRFLSGNHTLSGIGFTNSTLIFLTGSNVSLTSNHKVRDININSGGAFDITGKKLSVTASNPIINNGTFNTTSSTIEYIGTSFQNISFANISYKNLRINNALSTGLLNNISVADTLSVLSGDLFLFGFIITLSPVGFLVETPGNTVTYGSGHITTTRVLNAPSNLNVGGLGAVITTSQNLDTVEIRRGHLQFSINGVLSVSRYFDITPKNNSSLNATLVYKYDDSEVGVNNEGSLALFRSTNGGSTFTIQVGVVNTNTNANTITLSGIDAFSRWTAGRGAVSSQIKIIPEGFYNINTKKLAMKDTVRIYIRNNTPPYAIIDSSKSVIDSNNFTGTFNFLNTPGGRYYLQSNHRNSVETWSKDSGEVYTLGTGLNFDFTTNASQAFGNNMKQVDTSPIRFGVYSGDVTRDGSVDLTDITNIFNDANSFLTGYKVTDITGDRVVDLSDITLAYNNSANFTSVVRP